MKNHGACFRFSNGNWAFCDEEGQQLPQLQMLGEKGLAEFLKQFPKAEIHGWPDPRKKEIG